MACSSIPFLNWLRVGVFTRSILRTTCRPVEISAWCKGIGRDRYTLATVRCNVQINRFEYKDMSAYEKCRRDTFKVNFSDEDCCLEECNAV